MPVFLDIGREIVGQACAGWCLRMALGSPGSGSGLAVEKEESLTKHCSQLTGLWSVSMRPWPLSKLVGPGGG